MSDGKRILAATLVFLVATLGAGTALAGDHGDHGGHGGHCKKGGSHDEHLGIAQVPAAVRAAIEAEAQGGTIEEIECDREHGKMIFEAEIVKDGKRLDIELDESGAVLERKIKHGCGDCGADQP